MKTLLCLIITVYATVEVSCELLVHLPLGKVQGVTIKTPTGKKVEAFLGIPYAEPPTGNARFLPPLRKQPWTSDVLLADSLSNSCLQVPFTSNKNVTGFLARWRPKTQESEDCLYLNIWVPDPQPVKAAVMVWIHGGAFRTGSTSVQPYDGSILASEENVIVISINYRLSILGFLHLPNTEVKGNMGLLDQVEALTWIQEYIENFGGDKDRVTIFGESAGGISISLHLLSTKSQNLFHAAIVQSGPPDAIRTLSDVKVQTTATAKIIHDLNCSSTDLQNVVHCLQALDEKTIMSVIPKDILLLFVPVTDGDFLTNDFEVLILQKHFQNVPVLIGTTSEDGSMIASFQHPKEFEQKEDFHPTRSGLKRLVKELFPEANKFVHDAISFFYTDWQYSDEPIRTRDEMVNLATDFYLVCGTNDFAKHLAENGNTVYKYQFSQIPSISMYPKWVGSTHADEIDFVFGNLLRPSPAVDKQDIKLSIKMMHYWANFAKYGDPNGKSHSHGEILHSDLPKWPKFSLYHKEYIDLATNITHGKGLRVQQCAFWDEALPDILQFASMLENNAMCA